MANPFRASSNIHYEFLKCFIQRHEHIKTELWCLTAKCPEFKSTTQLWAVCAEFAYSPCACMGSHQVFWPPPRVQTHACLANSWFYIVSINACLSLCVRLAICPGSTSPLALWWDRLGPTAILNWISKNKKDEMLKPQPDSTPLCHNPHFLCAV